MFVLQFSSSQDEEEIDMDTVHDSQAFISHHLNMLERPSTPGKMLSCIHWGDGESLHDITVGRCVCFIVKRIAIKFRVSQYKILDCIG